MSFKITSLITFCVLLVSQVFAQKVIESFDYRAGVSIDTLLGAAGHGWAGSWDLENSGFDDHATGTITEQGLSYDDLNYDVPHVANQITVSNPGNWVAARWNRYLAQTWPDDGSTYWVSVLFQADAVPSDLTYYLFKLYKETASDTSEILAIGKGGGGFTYSCGSGWPGGSGPDVSETTCDAFPVWLVVRIDASGDTSADKTYMWIDPDPSVEPDINNADVVRDSYMNDGFNRVSLECGGADTMKTYWDEFRIGTSYTDVSEGIAPAYQPLIESFDYPAGASIDTLLGTAGNGWGSYWDLENSGFDDHATGTITEQGFSYDDLNYDVPHVANHITVSNPGNWVAARWNRYLAQTWPDDGSTYWVSLLFQADAVPSDLTYYLFKLYKETASDTSEIMAIGKGGGGFTYSCGSGWPGGSGPDVSETTCDAFPIWMVVRIDASGDTAADKTYMWIDPDPSAEPDINNADVVRDSYMNDGFNRVSLECGGADTMKTYWDEFRIGKSYGEVSSVITTTIDGRKIYTPDRISLSQNYPNPFNPTTRIDFKVVKSGNIKLAVYNIMGKEVATIAKGYYNQGSYTIQFSASKLASGIYFYKLFTADGSVTKKMTLIK